MILECEKCHTKFRLDDKLLKKTGSKVRCSICSHKFMVFPSEAEKEASELPEVESKKKAREQELASGFDKTLVADVIEEVGKAPPEEVSELDQTLVGIGFDEDEIEPVSFEDISQIDSGIIRAEAPDIDKAMERATKVEEKVIAKEEREKAVEVSKAEETVQPTPKIVKKRRPRLLFIVLILILLLIGSASAIVFFMPEMVQELAPFLKRPSKEQVLDMGNKRLSFSNLEGTFFDSKTSGKLFIVTGSVANNYPDKRNYLRVRSNILDSKGNVVRSKIVYAGNPISNEDLQTLPIEEINKRLMNREGRDNINMNVSPNASVPFMIVFENLPGNVSEFTVEAISSSPAKS